MKNYMKKIFLMGFLETAILSSNLIGAEEKMLNEKQKVLSQ